MLFYWPMATVKGEKQPLYTYNYCNSIEEALECFETWNENFHMIEKWIDVYEGDVKKYRYEVKFKAVRTKLVK